MRDDLVRNYKTAYKSQFEELDESFAGIVDCASDKDYALKFLLGLTKLSYAFTVVNELDIKIIELYEHSMKLGFDIVYIVEAIPSIIESFEKENNSVNLTWHKFLGIPYKVKRIHFSSAISSSFEGVDMLDEIASILGNKIAVYDYKRKVEDDYLIHGNLDTVEMKSFLPSEYKKLLNLKESLSSNDLTEFFNILKSFFASFSYDMKITEGYFHSHIHLVLTLLDFDILSEVETNMGRIDAVIETEKYIHIMEFKRDNSNIGMKQILEKKYYQKYMTTAKTIILVAVAIDTKERNIINWEMRSLNRYSI